MRNAGRMKADFYSEMTSPRNVDPVSLLEWRKPPFGYVKLNVDAAFFSELKVARLRIVVRDSRGEVLWCAMEKVTMVYSPLQAELLAILFGMHEMTGSPFQDIEVESDSLLAINEVENTNQSLCA